jgi:hypothetical protein
MSEFKTKIIEGFDCIAFKRKAQEQIHRETKGMTPEQELEYIHRKAREGEMGKTLDRLKKNPAVR